MAVGIEEAINKYNNSEKNRNFVLKRLVKIKNTNSSSVDRKEMGVEWKTVEPLLVKMLNSFLKLYDDGEYYQSYCRTIARDFENQYFIGYQTKHLHAEEMLVNNIIRKYMPIKKSLEKDSKYNIFDYKTKKISIPIKEMYVDIMPCNGITYPGHCCAEFFVPSGKKEGICDKDFDRVGFVAVSTNTPIYYSFNENFSEAGGVCLVKQHESLPGYNKSQFNYEQKIKFLKDIHRG